MKLKLDRVIVHADGETPRVREYRPESNYRILQWAGVQRAGQPQYELLPGEPKTLITIEDVLRAVYSHTFEGDTREDKASRGRLLKKLDGARRKKVPLELTGDEQKVTLDTAGRMPNIDVAVYIQIEDLLNEEPTLGDNIQEDKGTTEAAPMNLETDSPVQ